MEYINPYGELETARDAQTKLYILYLYVDVFMYMYNVHAETVLLCALADQMILCTVTITAATAATVVAAAVVVSAARSKRYSSLSFVDCESERRASTK